MLNASKFLCCVIFCSLTPHYAFAMSAEQKAKIHEHFEALGKTCFKENAISADDIAQLRARKIPSGANVPCFLACMMKQIGILNEEGAFEKETALELAKSVFEDEEEIKIIEDYLHSCSHINSEAVSDGNKGCDRAMAAYKCMLENSSKFGFDI